MAAKRVYVLFRMAIFSAVLLVCFSLLAGAQSAAVTPNPTEQLRDLLQKSRAEIKEFESAAKARPKDAIPPDNDPRLKWSKVLWEFREHHLNTPEAATATAESLRYQVQAGQFAEALSRVDSLSPDDTAWGDLLIVLRDAAERKGDDAIFLSRARALLARTDDKPLRARIQYNIGRVHQLAGRDGEAIAAFQAAVAEGDKLEYAKVASGRIYDLTKLRIGQPAPDFSVTALSGKTISLASLRGHTAVFVYWASW
jgi:tetratricopeptide (TPR) repeat protein